MLNENTYLTFGCEFEITNSEPCRNPNNRKKRHYANSVDFTPHNDGWGVDEWRRHLQAHGFDWVQVVHESTGYVAAEIVTPPIADCEAARSDIARLLSFIEASGGRGLRQFRDFQRDVTNGLHVHVGINVQDARRNSPTEFWSNSKELMRTSGRHYAGHPVGIMPLALAKDVICRWATNWPLIQTMLPRKRRSSWAALDISQFGEGRSRYNEFWAITSADNSDTAIARAARECAAMLGGKMAAVSMDTWARHGTIEFRQHGSTTDASKVWGWIELINTVFYTSANERIADITPAQPTVEQTPAHLFRRVSRVGVLYSMARVAGGVTTRELMAATGWDCGTIRARFSEIRSRLESRGLQGQLAVLQHSQQEYNHRYGSSNGQYDLGGYEVLTEYEVTPQAQPALLPDNRRAPATIWYGVTDSLFEYWQRRIEQIR
jgi:hypothetical protein